MQVDLCLLLRQWQKVLGISNVTRKDEVPDHPELLIVPPRMNLYMKRNSVINNLLKRFVADEDHSVFSVDESFIDITASLKYFNCDTAYRLAKIIQRVIYNHMGLYVTIGIGDNPLLAKLALDNEAKIRQVLLQNGDMKMYKKKFGLSPYH